MPFSTKTRNMLVAGGAFIFVGCMALLPMFITKAQKGEQLLHKESGLSSTQLRRGVFMNTGSKDMGRDQDWDKSTFTYKGSNMQK
mmetsp:Transcript_12699/g.18726  ORF Transcript_12699/g.18726 Transcript_12699/m.18726 type:complete len:85 (-) Transcript_12699:336-590(-)